MKTAQLSFDQMAVTENGMQRQFLVAGVDEVGRGPLVGNVVAAAVILDPRRKISGLADSKKLTEAAREALAEEIRSNAVACAVAEADAAEIDSLNILHASMQAMARAINALPVRPEHCLIDGNRCPDVAFPCQPVVGGDALVQEIAAASILAKVHRDRQMYQLHDQHPQYGFDRHKGYPTRDHLAAIQQFGILTQHRRSFAPVRACLETK